MKKMVKFICLAFLITFCACSEIGKTAGTDEQSEGIVAIKNREIAGVTQKGPFLMGASVTVQELDGHTLIQTGKSYNTSVKSNQGDFIIKGINLVSQYALLEVKGYYRNEVTGKESEGMVTLNALTNLNGRNHVNVNLLTHLEAERIHHLVDYAGMSFNEAKAQAERELFSLFGATYDLGKAEDADLFAGEGGAILLALSIMMQRDGFAVDLSERMAREALLFAEYANFDAEMADWAFDVERDYWNNSSNEKNILRRVRKNVESWKDGTTIPDFETAIYKFWVHEYGLGECSVNNVNEIRKNENILSQYYNINFICNSNGRWSFIRDREILNDGFGLLNDVEDGNVYKTVMIGNQKWMAENLRREDSSAFYIAYDHWKSYCYDFKQSYCNALGKLYSFEGASASCPTGYRVPNLDEVKALLQYYQESDQEVLLALRSMSGLGLEYGGQMIYDSVYKFKGIYEFGTYWIDGKYVLRIDSLGVSVDSISKEDLFFKASVRCIEKKEKVYDANSYMKDSRDGNTYRFTEIAGKFWMAENLRYKGDSTSNLCMPYEKECFYLWKDAVGVDSARGICPEGWHIPSRDEWDSLLTMVADNVKISRVDDSIEKTYYGANNDLSDVHDWFENGYVIHEVNDPYGFSVKPVGSFFDGLRDERFSGFWTSSSVIYNDWDVNRNGVEVQYQGGVAIEFDGYLMINMSIKSANRLYSVRCVKDL